MRIAATLVLAAVLAGGCTSTAVGGVASYPKSADAQAGACVNLRPAGATGTTADVIGCTAPDATYEIGSRHPGTTGACPTESYDQYTQTGTDGDFTLCLMMNGKQGDCFDGYATPNERKAKVDCKDADVIVSKRLDGRADPSSCPADSGWQLAYPQPGRTLCLTPLHGTPTP